MTTDISNPPTSELGERGHPERRDGARTHRRTQQLGAVGIRRSGAHAQIKSSPTGSPSPSQPHLAIKPHGLLGQRAPHSRGEVGPERVPVARCAEPRRDQLIGLTQSV